MPRDRPFASVTFAVANTAAVLAALYIAFALDLERPYWALFTVFIIAKPISGAVRSKAVYRFAGTLAGASMALFLIPPLVQAPVLLCLAISAWVGVCLYFSLLDRTPRSYLFMLAGYTAAIIGFSVVDTPTSIFDVTVSRVEEISLGIVCGSIAHSVFFPQNITAELDERIEHTIRGCAAWISRALMRRVQPEDDQAAEKLAPIVTELHTLYTHVSFETSDVGRAGGAMRALQNRLAMLPGYISMVQKTLEALTAAGCLRPAVKQVLERVSGWTQNLSETDDFGSDINSMSLPTIVFSLDEETCDLPEWQRLLELALRTQLSELVAALRESCLLASRLRDSKTVLPAALQREVEMVGARSLHRDRGLAALSGCAAAVACLIACVLWIGGAWPEGGVAAQFAAIGCSLFATLDRPSKLIYAAVVGILIALPFAAVYEFAIFPRIDGFASLALVLTPALLIFSLMQTSEKLEGAAMVLAIAFAGALALQSSYRADFAAFANTNTAEVMGLLIANVAILVFRTIDPSWNAMRISRAGWRSVSQLAAVRTMDIGGWAVQMFDRLGLVTSRLQHAEVTQVAEGLVDPLRDLRVGIHVAALKKAEGESEGRSLLGRVLVEISEVYEALAAGGNAAAVGELRASIDAGIKALTLSSSASDREGLAALTALRLDLAPSALPYEPTLAAA